jgi:hypothetical protein
MNNKLPDSVLKMVHEKVEKRTSLTIQILIMCIKKRKNRSQ